MPCWQVSNAVNTKEPVSEGCPGRRDLHRSQPGTTAASQLAGDNTPRLPASALCHYWSQTHQRALSKCASPHGKGGSAYISRREQTNWNTEHRPRLACPMLSVSRPGNGPVSETGSAPAPGRHAPCPQGHWVQSLLFCGWVMLP